MKCSSHYLFHLNYKNKGDFLESACWLETFLLHLSAPLAAFLSFKDAQNKFSLLTLYCRHKKKMENEWRCYHCYPPLKSFSYNFFPWPRYWKVIWSPVCGSKDRMDEHWVSLGHCLCFKAVWETARGEEFISSSEQSRDQPSRTSKQEFKGIISKQLEDDSHRWDWMSQILRRYWGELISQRRAMICGLHLLNHSLFGGCVVVAFSVNLLPLF